MAYNLHLITAPTVEPVSLAELIAHARISGTAENAILTRNIAAAREVVEAITHRALITQTWELIMPLSWAQQAIDIAKPPLQSITSIKVLDWDDAETEQTASTYLALTKTTPGRVLLKDGESWPTSDRDIDNFIIRFVAGYGDTSADVPQKLREAVLEVATRITENRGDEELVIKDIVLSLNQFIVMSA
jgi:uncharacterized phiE125 gp8 family phage protein